VLRVRRLPSGMVWEEVLLIINAPTRKAPLNQKPPALPEGRIKGAGMALLLEVGPHNVENLPAVDGAGKPLRPFQ